MPAIARVYAGTAGEPGHDLSRQLSVLTGERSHTELVTLPHPGDVGVLHSRNDFRRCRRQLVERLRQSIPRVLRLSYQVSDSKMQIDTCGFTHASNSPQIKRGVCQPLRRMGRRFEMLRPGQQLRSGCHTPKSCARYSTHHCLPGSRSDIGHDARGSFDRRVRIAPFALRSGQGDHQSPDGLDRWSGRESTHDISG